MDYKEPPAKRQKKKDKAREKHDRNGSYSAKHIRLATAITEAVKSTPAPANLKGAK